MIEVAEWRLGRPMTKPVVEFSSAVLERLAVYSESQRKTLLDWFRELGTHLHFGYDSGGVGAEPCINP